MDSRLKQRLVGAAVLISLAVIILPMVLQGPDSDSERLNTTTIPPKPASFDSGVTPVGEPEQVNIAPQTAGSPPAVTDSEPPSLAGPAGADRGTEDTGSSSVQARAAVAEKPRPPVGAWVVQVGSFAAEANAVSLRDRLRTLGYPAFVEEKASPKRKVYRVRIGPELTRTSADSIKDKLEKSGEFKPIVLRYP